MATLDGKTVRTARVYSTQWHDVEAVYEVFSPKRADEVLYKVEHDPSPERNVYLVSNPDSAAKKVYFTTLDPY